MEKFEKIFELLEKKVLSEEEQRLLKSFADSDEEIKSFLGSYKSLNLTFNDSNHLPIDLLSSYILYINGDDAENKIISILKTKIEAHLNECKICTEEFNLLNTEYDGIQKHIDGQINRSTHPEKKKNEISILSIFSQNKSFKYAFATLSVLFIAYFGLTIISTSLTPDYKKNIFLSEGDNFYLTRGRTSDLFQQGLNEIDKGNYSSAIVFLQKDIDEHKNEKSIFYSFYILGITNLKASETSFVGLFKSYNTDYVNQAILNFRESIDKNTSGDYESLKLDSYYYTGRAYLLIDEKDSAKIYLQKVIDGKGRFANSASELIIKMERN